MLAELIIVETVADLEAEEAILQQVAELAHLVKDMMVEHHQ